MRAGRQICSKTGNELRVFQRFALATGLSARVTKFAQCGRLGDFRDLPLPTSLAVATIEARLGYALHKTAIELPCIKLYEQIAAVAARLAVRHRIARPNNGKSASLSILEHLTWEVIRRCDMTSTSYAFRTGFKFGDE